jgi:hypothetical protein
MEEAIRLAKDPAQRKHVGTIYVTDAPNTGCAGVGTWNLLPGRCTGDALYWPRLKELTN